jgi:hypothetical protein
VRSLIAIVSPKKNASQTPSFASILRAGLAENALVFPEGSPFYGKAQTVFSSGVKNWLQFDAPPKPSPQPSLSPSVFEPLALPAPSPTTVDATNAVARVASSLAERRLLFQRETPTGGRSSHRWSRPGSFALGKAIHACFETVRWLDVDGAPCVNLLRERLKSLGCDAADVRRTLERFDEICATPFVRKILSRSSYSVCRSELPIDDAASSAVLLRPEIKSPTWEVFQERPFSFLSPDGRLWRGTIDRLVLLRDGGRVVGADVIDFKTDRISLQRVTSSPSGDVFPAESNFPLLPDAETLSAYRRQLEVYGAVVAGWYSLPPERISLRLAFVSEGFAFVPAKQPISCQRDLSDASAVSVNDEATFFFNTTHGDAQC